MDIKEQREGERERTKKEGMRMGPNVDSRGGKDRERRGERGKKIEGEDDPPHPTLNIIVIM